MDHISHVRKSLGGEVEAGVVEHLEVEVGMGALGELGSRRRSMGDI